MINMSTPYADMHREFWNDYDKQEYWVDKWARSRGKDLQRTIRCALSTHSKLVDKVEYKRENGNRWINYVYAHPIVRGKVGIEYHSVCYWDAYGSFGTFTAYGRQGERLLIISTTHYWQRYCERSHTDMRGVHTAMDFYADHPSCQVDILPPAEGDTRRQICIHYTCGAAFGVEVSQEYKVFELRTYIDNASMTGDKARRHQDVKRTMESDITRKGFSQIQSIMASHPGIDLQEAMRYVSREYYDETNLSIARHTEENIRNRMTELRATLTHEQAIEQCLKETPLFINPDERLPDDMARFYISTCDRTHTSARAEVKLKEYIDSLEARIGDIPDSTKEFMHDIYIDGFLLGSEVLAEYLSRAISNDTDLPMLQEFKHGKYMKFRDYLNDYFAGSSHSTMIVQQTSSAHAFDDGIEHTASLADKYLGIDILSKFN